MLPENKKMREIPKYYCKLVQVKVLLWAFKYWSNIEFLMKDITQKTTQPDGYTLSFKN